MSYKDTIHIVHGPYLDMEMERQIVIIVYKDGSKVTKSYARHLMEIHLNRQLSLDEEVDHKDENKLNDTI